MSAGPPAPSFDLLSLPWIPVVLVAGDRRQVSLRGVFNGAHRLAKLDTRSPLIDAAMHRLLLAILHRALSGPRDADEWGALWRRARFNDRIHRYLDGVREGFDLLSPTQPFYQAPMAAAYRPRPATGLVVDSRDYGAVADMMDPTPRSDTSLSLPAAALHLVTHQAYALGGLTSRLPGESPSAKGAPLTAALVVQLQGSNLFETLMLNLHRYEPSTIDLPAWERGRTENGDRRPDGLVDWFTWQPRRLLLSATDDDPPVIREVCIARGWGLPADWNRRELETAAPFRANRPTKAKPLDWYPVGLSLRRPTWRDSSTLLLGTDERARPRIFDWLGELEAAGALPSQADWAVETTGVALDQFKILCWRRDRLPIPPGIRQNPHRMAAIASALSDAEIADSILRGVIRSLWPPQPPSDRQPPWQAAVDGAATQYWSALERGFKRWLTEDGDSQAWQREVTRQVFATWRAYAADRPRLLQLARAEVALGRRLRGAWRAQSTQENANATK